MKKLYGTPTLIVLLSALVGWVLFALATSPEDTALSFRMPLDLLVYTRAGEHVYEGLPLYADSFVGKLPFTYPPISGVLFAYVSLLSDTWTINLWQGGSILAMLLVVLLVLRERGFRLGVGTTIVAVLLTVLSIALEPVHGTLFFGQINILLLLLVALDLLPRRWRWPGIGIGLAASLKLTPAYLGLVLLVQRRWWAALGTILTFLAAMVAGFFFVKDAGTFWTEAIFNSGRVGVHRNPGAQSLRSVMEREWGIEGGGLWVVAVLITVAVTILAVKVAVRRGNLTAAMALTGISACLVSPFSWFHHWIWVVPMALVVFVAVNQSLGARLKGAMGAQVAAVASLVAMVLTALPFISEHVWYVVSYRNLDSVPGFQPWGSLMFCAWGFGFILLYALSGYVDRPRGRHAL